MNATPSPYKWKSRTVNGVFQINFETTYRGYEIRPSFNFDDGTSDFDVFKIDYEEGTFHRGTLSAVKRRVDEMIAENPTVILVKTMQSKPMIAGGYNLTKFYSPVMAALFADRFKGEII